MYTRKTIQAYTHGGARATLRAVTRERRGLRFRCLLRGMKLVVSKNAFRFRSISARCAASGSNGRAHVGVPQVGCRGGGRRGRDYERSRVPGAGCVYAARSEMTADRVARMYDESRERGSLPDRIAKDVLVDSFYDCTVKPKHASSAWYTISCTASTAARRRR
jgi:hypothetical protein